MEGRVEWKGRGLKVLNRLDKRARERIVSAVEQLAATGHGDVKKLQGGIPGTSSASARGASCSTATTAGSRSWCFGLAPAATSTRSKQWEGRRMAEITLVYQPVPPDRRSNAFADAIGRVVEPADAVALVSPYLAHSILTAVIGAREFRLVTDVEACLEGGADPALARFLAQHHEAIRDARGVHAKVVIGTDLALLGSANLTTQGLGSRFEMGCLVHDENAIAELRQWFEALWTHAAPLDVAKIDATTSTIRATPSASGDGPTPLAARTGDLGWLAVAARDSAASPGRARRAVPSEVAAEDLEELSRRLSSLTRSRAEARQLLEMLRGALQTADLAPDDDRLHLNFSRPRRLSISIGQRHVAWCRAKAKIREFGMMLDDFDLAERTAAAIDGARVDAYTKNFVPVVPELYVPVGALERLSTGVLESWRRAIRWQVRECGKSSYRDKKRVALYDMLLDDDLRAEAIRAAHPSA